MNRLVVVSNRVGPVKAAAKAAGGLAVALVDALGADRATLVGHDWGGIVAQELALLVPRRVRRLAIMNIAVLTNPIGTREARKIIFENGGVPFWYQYFQQQPMLPEAMIKGNEAVWIRYFLGKAGQETIEWLKRRLG